MKTRNSAFLSMTLFFSAMCGLAGCATIFSGPSEYIKIGSGDPALNGEVRAVALTDKGRAPRTMVLGDT